jgi:hypothetical protein
VLNLFTHVDLQIQTDASVSSLIGDVEMEHPNKLIESFTGVVDLGKLGREPVQASNILLRGCVLRNTDWIIGTTTHAPINYFHF